MKLDHPGKNSPQHIKLLSKFGPRGYGLFWLLAEEMRLSTGRRLNESQLELWKAAWCPGDGDEFVDFLVNIGLAVKIDEHLSIDQFLSTAIKADKISKARSQAAKLRWTGQEKEGRPASPSLPFAPPKKEAPKEVIKEDKRDFKSMKNITDDKLWPSFKEKVLQNKFIIDFGYRDTSAFDSERGVYATAEITQGRKDHYKGFVNWMIRDWMKAKYINKPTANRTTAGNAVEVGAGTMKR